MISSDKTSIIPDLSAAQTPTEAKTEVKKGVVVHAGHGNVGKVKTEPALYELKLQGDIDLDTPILIVDNPKQSLTESQLRIDVKNELKETKPDTILNEYLQHLYYVEGDITDVEFVKNKLLPKIAELEGKYNLSGNTIVYMGLPPQLFKRTIKALGEAGYFTDRTNKIMVEKPVGKDKASAKKIIDVLRQYCLPSQVYFLDHYNGKESIRNILYYRFANPWLEEILNRQYIESIEINIPENNTVDARNFPGSFQDMVPNHVMQMLAWWLMGAPNSLNPEDIAAEKVKLLSAVVVDANSLVLGSYQSEGTHLYCAFTVFVNNSRWAKVPIGIRTGKGLIGKLNEGIFHLKPIPSSVLFDNAKPNQLTFRMQPHEGIYFDNEVKELGSNKLGTKTLSLPYQKAFGRPSREAYEPLILECMKSDQTWFVSAEEILASWDAVAPIMERLNASETNGNDALTIHQYERGTDGPDAAQEIMTRDGRRWSDLSERLNRYQ